MTLEIAVGSLTEANMPFSTAPDGKSSSMSVRANIQGICTAHLEVYDPTNAFTLDAFALIAILDTVAADFVFQGFVQKVTIRVVATYRWLILDCVDASSVTDTILVGVPDGGSWSGPDGQGQFTLIDPAADIGGGTDASRVAFLNTNYGSLSPYAMDVTTYVQEINGNLNAGNPYVLTGDTLRGAMSKVAGLSAPTTIFFWDASFRAHLTIGIFDAAGGDKTHPEYYNNGGFRAPFNLSDSPDGVTTLGYENLALELDYSGYATSIYVRGGTTFTYNDGAVQQGGTGWVSPGSEALGPILSFTKTAFQRFVDGQAVTDQETLLMQGLATLQRMQQPIVRGSCEVVVRDALFLAGQIVEITSVPGGLDAYMYYIQSVDMSVLSGTDLRRYKLNWGSAPAPSLGLRQLASGAGIGPPQGASMHVVYSRTYGTIPLGDSTVIVAQLQNTAGLPWAISGKAVHWSCFVYAQPYTYDGDGNLTGVDVSDFVTFTLDPVDTVTLANGSAQTILTTDPAPVLGPYTLPLQYVVIAETPD